MSVGKSFLVRKSKSTTSSSESVVSVELECIVEGSSEHGVHTGVSVEQVEEGFLGDMV